MSGDNMLTALSVARQCAMVPERERVILIHTTAPEPGKPATIKWEAVEELDQDEGALDVDEVGLI